MEFLRQFSPGGHGRRCMLFPLHGEQKLPAVRLRSLKACCFSLRCIADRASGMSFDCGL
jgi:hypothetical protein